MTTANSLSTREHRDFHERHNLMVMSKRSALPKRGVAVSRVGGWAGALGEKRRAREMAAAGISEMKGDASGALISESLARWPPIAEAIGRLVGAYNAGADRTILSLRTATTMPHQPAITIESEASGEERPSLSVALDGTLIRLSGVDGRGVSFAAEYRVREDRSNDSTAAYLVQNWMESL
jgi:hypothetical protein